jgi:hypothetical protein
MRKLLIGLALSFIATAASAEWAFVVSETPSGDRYLADPTTQKRTGNVVRIWQLTDYVKPLVIGGKAYYSVRAYMHYDCAERTQQILQLAFFAGKMLTGELGVADNQLRDKQFIAPQTTGEAMLNFACK